MNLKKLLAVTSVALSLGDTLIDIAGRPVGGNGMLNLLPVALEVYLNQIIPRSRSRSGERFYPSHQRCI